jgi:hypothetical protein
VTGDTIPDVAMRNLYELEFRLLRSILSDEPHIAEDPNAIEP